MDMPWSKVGVQEQNFLHEDVWSLGQFVMAIAKIMVACGG